MILSNLNGSLNYWIHKWFSYYFNSCPLHIDSLISYCPYLWISFNPTLFIPFVMFSCRTISFQEFARVIRARHDVFSKILSSDTETERILAKVFTCCLLLDLLVCLFLLSEYPTLARSKRPHRTPIFNCHVCLKRNTGIRVHPSSNMCVQLGQKARSCWGSSP